MSGNGMTPEIALDVVRFQKASVAEKECQVARMTAAATEVGERWIWSRLGFLMVFGYRIYDRDSGSSTGDMICGFVGIWV